MLRVIAVIEEDPVVEPAVAANAPRDRFMGFGAVMTEIAVQIAEAVAQVEKRQEKKDHVAPVKAKHHEQGGCE